MLCVRARACGTESVVYGGKLKSAALATSLKGLSISVLPTNLEGAALVPVAVLSFGTADTSQR